MVNYPTSLVFNAFQNTSTPIIYNTSDEKGKSITTDCRFMDPRTDDRFEEIACRCTICGADAKRGINTKKLLGSSYTDWSRHKAPESNYICEACAFTMMLNVESSRCALFRYSFVAEKSLHICNRAEMRDWIISPPEPPFVMAVAVSQKKHIAIKSAVSYQKDRFICNLEEEQIIVNRCEAENAILLCEALRGIGMTKDEISDGTIRYEKIKDFGVGAYEQILNMIKPYIGKRIFALCVFVSQKMNEEEAICYLGLKRKTGTSQPEHCSSMQYTAAETSKEARQAMKCGGKSNALPVEPLNEQMTLAGF